MPDLVTLTCPTCGSKLQITDDIYTYTCEYCANRYIVKRELGAISLDLISQDVRRIRSGVDKTAAELAIVRLEKEIAVLERERDQVLAKTDADWAGGFGLGKTLFWLGLVAFMMGIASGGYYNVFLLGGIVGIPLSVFLYVRRQIEIQQMRKSELDRVNDFLLTKHALLDQNRWIIEN